MATTWRELRALVSVGIVLCIGAAIALYVTLPGMLAGHALYHDALGFAETPCTQVRTGTIRDEGRYRTYYWPLLVCDYMAGERPYQIDSRHSELGFAPYHTRNLALAAAEQRAHAFPQHAYYDPHDPARAAMSRDIKYDTAQWIVVAFACLAGALGVAMLIAFVIRGSRLRRRERRDHDDFPSARVL